MRMLPWLRNLLLLFVLTGPALAAPPLGDPALPAKDWRAIRQVVEEQLKALKSGNGERAMNYASLPLRAQFRSPENFLRMVRAGYAPLLDAHHTQFLEGSIVEGAVLQPLQLVLPDDSVLVAIYQLEKQDDGQWRIAGCAIAPSKAIAT